MTSAEYLQAKEAIEQKYKEDMAAIERAWIIINGTRAPDGVIDPEDVHRVGVHSAEALGIPSSGRIEEGHRTYKKRESLKGLSAEEKKEHKRAYMKAYLAKRRAAVK